MAFLYAFVLTFASVDVDLLGRRFSSRMPRRGPAYFMAASEAVTLVVWGAPILAALTEGRPPEKLDMYTTKVTEALDLAIITPATFLACVLILRSAPLGYLVALSLLVLEALLAPLIVAQTVSQLAAGVSFTLVQMIGPITGFSVLGIVSVWIIWAILRNVNERPSGNF